MKKVLKTLAASLLITSINANAWAAAAPACAKPEDVSALRAAQVQQQLMVAALSCNAISLYNNFVTAYQKDLQKSDQALQNFFRRMNGKTGTADYHAFKTKMANSSSMQSIGDMTGYCAKAQAAFDEALGTAKASLTAFLSDQATSVEQNYTSCDALNAPQMVPVPRAKPVETAALPVDADTAAPPQP